MQPEDDERFEQYLKQFEPLPPGPLQRTIRQPAWSPQALAAVAAVFVAGVCLVLWESRNGMQLVRPNLARASAVVQPTAMDKGAGKSIPDLDLPDLTGSDVRLSELRGKVLLVNFWASWCVPCQTEMPWLTQFQERYAAQGFQVVAISMDEDQSQCGPFVERHGLENLMVLLGDSHAANRFGGVVGLPTSFLVDRDGKIVSKHPGVIDRGAVEKEILDLLQRPEITTRSLITLSQFNRLLDGNPSQLDAQLISVSRGLLPNVERPGSTLGALSSQ